MTPNFDGQWYKSSRSTERGTCVEVAFASDQADAVAVRDTKNREQGHFTVNRAQFAQFVNKARSGGFPI